MFAKTAVPVVLGIFAGALILVGVSFAGFAIFSALAVPVGTPGAAALTALILLIGPLLFMLIARLNAPAPANDTGGEATLLNVFAVLAKDKPLLAVLGAGLFGAADVWFRKKR